MIINDKLYVINNSSKPTGLVKQQWNQEKDSKLQSFESFEYELGDAVGSDFDDVHSLPVGWYGQIMWPLQSLKCSIDIQIKFVVSSNRKNFTLAHFFQVNILEKLWNNILIIIMKGNSYDWFWSGTIVQLIMHRFSFECWTVLSI